MRDDLDPLKPTIPIPEQLSPDYLEFNGILPLALEAGRVKVAAAREPARHVLDDLLSVFGVPVEVVMVEEEALHAAIRRASAASESVVELVRDLEEQAGVGGHGGAGGRRSSERTPAPRMCGTSPPSRR